MFGSFEPVGTRCHLDNWSELTQDPYILECIQGTKIELASFPEQQRIPRGFAMSKAAAKNVTAEVETFLSKNFGKMCP